MNRVELYGEGKFTEYGELVVVRGGRLVRMECPMSGFFKRVSDTMVGLLNKGGE